MLRYALLALDSARYTRFGRWAYANRTLLLMAAYVAVAVIISNYSLVAFAEGDPAAAANEAFEGINTSICAFIDVMRSGFTYAIVLGAVVIGGIMRAAGSRAGIGVIVGALIGGLIVLVAPSVATVFFPAATECAAVPG